MSNIDTISRCCAQCGVRQYGMCGWSGCACHHRHIQAEIQARFGERQLDEDYQEVLGEMTA